MIGWPVLGARTDASVRQHRTTMNTMCPTGDLSALADRQHVLILHNLVSSYRTPLGWLPLDKGIFEAGYNDLFQHKAQIKKQIKEHPLL